MNIATAATLVYGILLLIGGIIGYVTAKSKPSLISGVVSGLLLLVTSFLQLQQIALAFILARIVTILLTVVFAIRFWKTKKLMPAGIMLVVSVAILVILVQTSN
ncbi:MAG: TMEM14 family protein [Crocosphaera sp.]|nr:TMEM14 family protein [Crocosphaera sp.]